MVSRDRDNSKHYVHRLVALAFLGQPPVGKYLVRHLNGDKRDNRVENLAWGDDADNMADSLLQGAIKRGTAHPCFRSHCQRGHELTGDNVKVFPTGKRRCRVCMRMRDRLYRQGLRVNVEKPAPSPVD